MSPRTIKGKPVTDYLVQGWADEAEAGYPVEQLRKRVGSRWESAPASWFRFASTPIYSRL